MKEELKIKLQELSNMIELDKLDTDICEILSENKDESILLGTNDAYLKILKLIIDMLLINKEINFEDSEFDYDKKRNTLINYQIKNLISEFSDTWIVSMYLTDNENYNSIRNLFKNSLT